MSVRYAVYLAPPPDSALWRFGAQALGRDAATGEAIEGFAPRGLSPQDWRALTAEPRRYGFHATLKAPFALAEGAAREDLESAVAQLAASVTAFDLGALQVSALSFGGGGFLALAPVAPPPALGELEARAVRELDRLRAPATDEEIARRRPDRLTPRQHGYLHAWGYPYVLEEFRLHFTLSGATQTPSPLVEAVAEAFAASVREPQFRVDALTLFVQPDGGDFRLLRRFAFKTP
jgi:putative phosphonate metabolism protein